MITANIYNDTVVTGFSAGDTITLVSQNGTGTWVTDAAGNIVFTPNPGDECSDASATFRINSECCEDTFTVSYEPDCTGTTDCETWKLACPNLDPVLPYDCTLGPLEISLDFSDNLVNGAATIHEQRLLAMFTWLNGVDLDFSTNSCEMTLEESFPAQDNHVLKVIWSWTAPGPSGLIEVCDSAGNLTESIVFADTCAAPFEIDLQYQLTSVAMMSTTGSLNLADTATLAINPTVGTFGACN